jgi:hypothetical protein
MKKDLEKAVQLARQAQKAPSEGSPGDSRRGSDANSTKMTGMRAKLYHDVQTAESYNTSTISLALNKLQADDGDEGEEQDLDDGLFSLSIHELSCALDHSQLEQTDDSEVHICWLFNAGSGSISDRSYESFSLPLQQILDWKFISSTAQHTLPPPPVASVTCNDHLCFEFSKIVLSEIKNEPEKKIFIGSVILPIEDILLHSNLSKTKPSLQCVEETILSDDAVVIGQMKLQFMLQ